LVNEETSGVDKEDVPDETKRDAREIFRSKVLAKLRLQNVPVTLGLVVLFYLCLPSSVAVIVSSHIELWNFDLLPSLLLALEVGVGGCLVFAFALLIKMVRKWRKSR
jgi:hypothetical protein